MGTLIPIAFDWETHYSPAYSLRRMTTTEYILHPDFEIIGLGICFRGLTTWFSGSVEELQAVLDRIDWKNVLFIAHNAMFDGAILEWVFNKRPAQYFCTMMGSRPYVTPYTGRSDLATVLPFLELGEKGAEVHSFASYRRKDFSDEELRQYGEYCKNDARGAFNIYEWLSSRLPEEETQLIDLTVKKFVRPQLALDPQVIQHHLQRIFNTKGQLVGKLKSQWNVTATQIRSRQKFAELLTNRGVRIPTKVSASTGAETMAMSKQDAPFVELLGHPDPVVRALVEARFTLASNMEETRLERLQALAALNFKGACLLPVPLLYYGAHTGRFSGLDKINLQNPPRPRYMPDGSLDPESGSIRRAIIAPKGHKVIAADLAQIEARIVATLARAWELVKTFRTGDPYAAFASRIYGRPINKRDNPEERFVGKTCILGLGYGMGHIKFQKQMVLAGRTMRNEEAKRIVYLYRETYPEIPNLWSALEHCLSQAQNPRCMLPFGPITFLHERILLPNGMPIIYPGLRRTHEGLVFRDRRSNDGELGIWGGATCENVVQALARIVLTRAELRLARAGLRAALQVHDELVFCVQDAYVEKAMQAIRIALEAPVDFLPELPVAVEIHAGDSYIECK